MISTIKNYIREKEYLFLLAAFLIIVFIKVILSLWLPTPFVFGDEWLYADYAKDILSNPMCLLVPDRYQIYPPGYPLILSPSFFFYPNMGLVYRGMFIINALVSSSVLFIAYLILKRYVDNALAVLGAILIAVLPINTLYTFIIFSENLFIPLFLLSAYLILKSFETDNKFLHAVTGFVIFYLLFTRTFGIAAYISFLVVLGYCLLIEEKRIDFIKNKLYLWSIPIAGLSIYYLAKEIRSTSLQGYDTGRYISNLLDSFTNIENFTLFLKLIIHEIDYLLLASYFVFFLLAIVAIFYWCKLDKTLRILWIYAFVFGGISILITVLHMLNHVSNPSDPAYMQYFIWGRYMDPVLPLIFICGIISGAMFIRTNGQFKKFAVACVFAYVLFVVTYPYDAVYKVVNVLSIYYTKMLINEYVIAFIVFIGVFTFFITYLLWKKNLRYVMIFLILFSIIISIPAFNWIDIVGNNREKENGIGRWLTTYGNEGDTILMDADFFTNPYTIKHCLIKFWGMPMQIRYGSNFTNVSPNMDFIITDELLPYQIITGSDTGLKLYKPEIARLETMPYTLNIGSNDLGHIKNFHKTQPSRNTTLRWTKNVSYVKIPISVGEVPLLLQLRMNGWRPINVPPSVSLVVNGHLLSKFSVERTWKTYTFTIPEEFLTAEPLVIEIHSETFVPSMCMNSSDSREIGVMIDWIKVGNN
jgi:hypothetical protein